LKIGYAIGVGIGILLMVLASWFVAGAVISLTFGILATQVTSVDIPALGYIESVWLAGGLSILRWIIVGSQTVEGSKRG
jgi:hypothetical protein